MNARWAVPAVSLVCIGALVTCAAARGAPPSGGSPPAPSTTGATASDQPVVEALVAEVRAQTQELEALVAQMRALLASRPRPPAANASDDEKKRYQQALDQWNAQVSQLEHAIDAKRQALDRAVGRLDTAVGQLAAPKRQDAESARKAAQAARAAAVKLLADLKQERSGAATPTRTPIDRKGPSPVKGATP